MNTAGPHTDILGLPPGPAGRDAASIRLITALPYPAGLPQDL